MILELGFGIRPQANSNSESRTPSRIVSGRGVDVAIEALGRQRRSKTHRARSGQAVRCRVWRLFRQARRAVAAAQDVKATKTNAARKPEMKSYTLPKDDLEAIVAYMASLKK